MQLDDIDAWKHRHAYAGEARGGERRTRWVIGITLAMMVGEILAGTVFGSMALLADGWHMGTHATALGGFASAVGLAVVALLVLGESAMRLASPVAIRFDEAIGVAVLGIAVSLFCAFLLRDDHGHHGHEHGDDAHHEAPDHHDGDAHGTATPSTVTTTCGRPICMSSPTR